MLRLKYCLLILPITICINGHAAQGLPGMAEAICRNQEQFVKCFSWSLEKCHENAVRALRLCLKLMPERPTPAPTLEEHIEERGGAGDWGVDFGMCGELALFKRNKDRVKPACLDYFAQRELDAKIAKFPFKLDEALEKETRARSNDWIQFLAILISGLLPPSIIAGLRWRKQRPKKFPTAMGFLLIFASIVGVVSGVFLLAMTGYFAEAIALRGDNPTATGGATMGFVALVPVYWLVLYLIYRRFRGQ